MTNDAVKSIIDAEAKAADKIKAAKEQAVQISAKAAGECEKIIADAGKNASGKNEQLMLDAKSRAAKREKEIAAESEKQTEAILLEANAKKQAAVIEAVSIITKG